ncbi:unnamed protein product [Ceratitis capitata]|uniref:(Mediterranean fruit fly) hypothetical protein n=1 Tax=Ceratitis capitata TaxID=7213 RepID=A0A811VHG7_CERCA|nr:unnamed protein product [Ceratitis capitata]
MSGWRMFLAFYSQLQFVAFRVSPKVEWKILLAIEGNRKEEEIEFFNIHIQSDFQYYAETRNQQQNVTAQHRKPIDPMKAEYPNRPHTVLAN